MPVLAETPGIILEIAQVTILETMPETIQAIIQATLPEILISYTTTTKNLINPAILAPKTVPSARQLILSATAVIHILPNPTCISIVKMVPL
jgi:hypothetical protein